MGMNNSASYIKGITVRLYEKVESGTDALNRKTYTETAVDVDNVLVSPVTTSTDEITDTLNLTGSRAVYRLAIPKGDTHDWTDSAVEFFGRKFRTIGAPVEGIEDMLPLEWNRQVRCEVFDE